MYIQIINLTKYIKGAKRKQLLSGSVHFSDAMKLKHPLKSFLKNIQMPIAIILRQCNEEQMDEGKEKKCTYTHE